MSELLSSFQLGSFVGGLLAGLAGGSAVTFGIMKRTSASFGGSVVDQTGAKAGGDVTGRDKISDSTLRRS